MMKPLKHFEVTLARMISFIFNPLWFSILFIIYLVTTKGYSKGDSIGIIIAGSLSAFILPVLIIGYMVKTGKTTTMDIPERSKRIVPFGIFSLIYLITFIVSVSVGLPGVFNAVLFAIFANTLLYGVITLWWKISIHCAGIAGYLSATTLILGHRHLILWLIVPILCWSRVRLKAHTSLQVIAGAILGGALTWIEIWLADYWFNIL
jgi:membrane-associated phospholipid phosphatase